MAYFFSASGMGILNGNKNVVIESKRSVIEENYGNETNVADRTERKMLLWKRRMLLCK